jgi:hypothetical protein
MSRHIVIATVAAVIVAVASVSSEASTRGEGVVRYGAAHRPAHRVKHPYRYTVPPAVPADPWAEWAARWSREVGNCPVGWYCYPQGNK